MGEQFFLGLPSLVTRFSTAFRTSANGRSKVVSALAALSDTTTSQQHLYPAPGARVSFEKPNNKCHPRDRPQRTNAVMNDSNGVICPRNGQPPPTIVGWIRSRRVIDVEVVSDPHQHKQHGRDHRQQIEYQFALHHHLETLGRWTGCSFKSAFPQSALHSSPRLCGFGRR
jgi:hypothetical protein